MPILQNMTDGAMAPVAGSPSSQDGPPAGPQDGLHFVRLARRNRIFGYATVCSLALLIACVMLCNGGLHFMAVPAMLSFFAALAAFLLWALNGLFIIAQYRCRIKIRESPGGPGGTEIAVVPAGPLWKAGENSGRRESSP